MTSKAGLVLLRVRDCTTFTPSVEERLGSAGVGGRAQAVGGLKDTGSGWEGRTQAVGGLKDTGSGWFEGHRQWVV